MELDPSDDARYRPYVAHQDGTLVGMLRASFDSDFNGNTGFDGFDLPPGPHGFIDSINVHPDHHRQGIGTALLRHYATEAETASCTFIGGTVDRTDDDTQRRAFFTSCGFDINRWGNFGQRTQALLTVLGSRT